MTRETLRARLEAATPGPWTADAGDPSDVVVWGPDGSPEPFVANVGNWSARDGEGYRQQFEPRDANDAALIAHARQDLPALLAVADAAAKVAPFLLAMQRSLSELYVNPSVIGDAQALTDALAALEAMP